MTDGDKKNESLVKTLSFACVHFVVAFLVGYLLTGSILVGSALALVEPLCNTVAFYFHERAWTRFSGRRGERRRLTTEGDLPPRLAGAVRVENCPFPL